MRILFGGIEMKKIIAIVLSIYISITLSGCHLLYKSWTGKRPCDQPDTSWISEDGSIYFYVDEGHRSTGTMQVDGENIDVYVAMGLGATIRIYPLSSLQGNTVKGECIEEWIGKFKKDKFTAKVLETTYFEEGQKIKFYRVDE